MRKLTLLLMIVTITSMLFIGCSGSSSVEDGDTDTDTTDGDLVEQDGDTEDDGDLDGDLEQDGDLEDGDVEQDGDVDGDVDGDGEEVFDEFNVPANGGTFTTDSGLELDIPSGALDEAVVITITEDNEKDIGDLESASTIFRFEPEGLTFNSPITVKIPYDTEKAGDSILTFYWTKAGDTSTFEAIADATFADGVGSAEISHFSHGFIGMRASAYEVSFDEGESWSLTYADDTSEDAGFQTDIALSSVDIPTGTAVTLSVNGTDLDPVNTDADGKAVFEDVTLNPGSNSLTATIDMNGTDIQDTATVTLSGCRLTFSNPVALQDLTDAGGDCSTTCGDDLDCNSPNLQYNIELTTENIGAGVDAHLSIGSGDPITAQVGEGVVAFNGVDLPHGDALTLAVEANNGDSEQCEVDINVNVALSCSCHLIFTEAPADYNSLSEDADLTAEGFQREFTVASDNCLDGSAVVFSLNDADTNATLADGEASVMLTLEDGSYTLDASITETDSGRTGALAEAANFKVDRTAPTFVNVTPVDGKMFTKLNDLNNDLSDGIQFNINGTTSGVETLTPPLEVALKINSADYGTATITNNGFSFSNVTIEAPGRLDPPNQYVLHLTIEDEMGNSAVKVINVNAYFVEPGITITQIGNKVVGSDEDPDLGVIVLNASDDTNTGLANLQATVMATTSLIEDGVMAELRINGQAPVTAAVNSGSVTWNVNLAYGDQALVAKALEVSGGFVQSETVDAFADAVAPTVAVTSPEADSYIPNSIIDVELTITNAEEGQKATLKVNNSLLSESGNPVEVAINSNGIALFEDVNLYNFSSKVEGFTLQGFITDKAGNAGQSSVITVNVDDTTPTVTVTVPDAEATGEIDHNEDIQSIVTVNDDDSFDGRPVVLKLYRQSDLVNPISTVGEDDSLLISGTTASYSYSSIADGSYRLVAFYTDKAGNEGSGYYEFTVDTGCYTFEISSLTALQYFNTATIDVTVNNISGGAVPIPDTTVPVTLYVNGSSVGFGAFSSGTYTFNNVTLNEGTNTLEARAFKEATSSTCTTGVMTVYLDTDEPTLALTSPAINDPIKFNATYADQDLVKAGFQTNLTFATTEVESGQSATLTVKLADDTVVDTVSANVQANNTVTFSKVTLQNSTTAPEGTALIFSATVTDKAGNTGTSASYNAMVDRTVPSFTSFNPANGSTLNKNDDAGLEADFQLDMTAVIAGGSAGTGNVTVEVTNSADPGNPYNIGPFNLVYNALQTRYEANITGTFTEGIYTFVISHTDDFGNQASTSVVYTIDYFAELTLRNKNNAIIEGNTYTWDATYDEDPGTDGFQATFWVSSRGLEDGAWVWLCSDMGSDPGYTVNCPGISCSNGTDYVLACVQIDVTSPETQSGLATFSGANVTHLLNSSTHTIYAEGLDGAGNDPQSGSAVITVDSVKPTVSTFVVDTNDPSNDNLVAAPNKLLALLDISYDENEFTGSNMMLDMTVTSADSDAKDAKLYIDPSTNPNAVSTLSLSAGSATFTNVPVSNGSHKLRTTIVDENGNESAGSDISVIVDVFTPIPSFVDAPGPVALVQADCNPDNGYDPCKYNLIVNIAKYPSETTTSMVGTQVTLEYPDTKYSASKTINTFTGESVDVTFTDFPLDQGATTVTVKAVDPRGNELQAGDYVTLDYNVDTMVPAVAYTVPTNPVSYTGANDSAACGGSLSDQYLTVCDWSFDVSGINTNNVTLELYAKSPSGSEFLKVNAPTDNTKILTADGAWNLSRVDFTETGAYTYKVKITEGTTGNTGESAELVVNVSDFTPTYVLDYQSLAGASFTTGKIFTELDDKDAVAGTVTVDFKVDTNGTIPDGETMTLDVNSVNVDSQTIASGIATFTDVVLNEGETNSLDVAVAGYTNSPITVIADTEDPVLVFTTPDPFKATYNASDDTDATHGDGVTLNSIVVQVDDLIDTTKTIKLVAEDGTKVQTTLGTANWVTSVDVGYQYKATFSSIKIPNGAAVTLDVLDNDSGNGVLDKAGHNGSVSNAPTMLVDDDPPSAISGLNVCVGGSTGSDDATFQQEPASCTTETYGCNSDDTRCNRRNGALTAYWTAAKNNESSNTGTASSYIVHVAPQIDIDAATCTPGTDCSCDNIDWDSAHVLATLETPVTGVMENATVTGLDVAMNTSYCVLVKAEDEAGNVSASFVSSGRELKFLQTTIKTGLANEASSLGSHISYGDLNDDGYTDFAISDVFGGAGFAYNGRINVFYGDSDASSSTYLEVLGTSPECIGSGMEIGDVNGDGFDDLVAGAYGFGNCEFAPYYRCDGRLHLMMGSVAKSLSIDHTFTGVTNSYYQLGNHVDVVAWDSPAKAVDTYKDIFVGTWLDDDGTPSASNESPIYMLYGRSNANWNLLTGDITADKDLEIQREAGSTETYSAFGRFLGHGDFDGDGVEDLLISDTDHTDAGGNADRFWILWGDAGYASPLVADDSSAAFTRVDNINTVIADTDDWGFEVAGIADTNNDGKDEAVIMMQGSKALYYLPDVTNPSDNVVFAGTGVLRRPASAGDFNHDGFNDLVFGDASGKVKVYFGGQDANNGNAPVIGTGDNIFITIGSNALMASGVGDFDGDGYDDIAVLDNTTNIVYLLH